MNDINALTQAGIAGFALFILLSFVQLARRGDILFGSAVEKERQAYRERIESLEAIIKSLGSSQSEQVMPALRDSITAAVETDAILKQFGGQMEEVVRVMRQLRLKGTDDA